MKKKIIIAGIIIAFLAVFLYLQNNWIGTNRLELAFERLPESFEEFKIIQLSDLHGKAFGAGQQRLVRILKKAEPDMIVITGDLIDGKRLGEQAALELVSEAVKIAPVYFVTGNHEWWSGIFGTLEARLKEAGAAVLRNEWKEIDVRGQKICLAGVDDPASAGRGPGETGFTESTLQEVAASMPEDSFKILLSHRPEKLPQYSAGGFDLVFSGHAHGGQFRLPFTGGLFAPDQGFFPEYTSGVHREQSTVMVISRGLGNSIIPQRLFNRPEVVQVTLKGAGDM